MPTIEDLDEFHVDKELRALIPTPTTEELRGLVEDIERDGRILSPLVVWAHDGEHTLIDGHNRLDAWESLGRRGVDIPPPDVVVKEFADRVDVKVWMYRHALNQRNPSAEQQARLREERDKLIRELYEREKKDKAANLTPGNAKSASKSHGETSKETGGKRTSTAEKVADAFGVSKATVNRVVAATKPKPAKPKQYADTFDTEQIDEELREASIVRDGAERPVPESLREQHAAASALAGIATLIDEPKRRLQKLRDEPGGEHIDLTRIESLVKELKGAIREARYYTECPTCRGKVKKSCRRCSGSGFIPFRDKGRLSQDEQDWLETTK